EDGRVGSLGLGEIGQCLSPEGASARLTPAKPSIPIHQPRHRLISGGSGVFRRWSHRVTPVARARSPAYASNPVHLEQYCASSANTGTSPAQRGMLRSCRLAWPLADRPPLLRFSPSVTPWSSKLGPTARHSAIYSRRRLAFKKTVKSVVRCVFIGSP